MADAADIANDVMESRLQDTISRIRLKQPNATDAAIVWCVECDSVIPWQRRKALPGVDTCVDCQSYKEGKR